MLEVERIVTCYGDFKALHQVSLRLEDGEMIAIIGPNGHGKSTLLKTICGLIQPAQGSVRLDGKQINGLPAHEVVRQGLVYVAESRHLFPEMTVLENLKLGAFNRNARRREAENMEYVFRLFPKLKERRKQDAATLSGGEARMLAIGRGLMASAKILAIDEPSLGLAPKLIIELFRTISEINRSGIAVLLVEQTIVDVAESLQGVNRMVLLEDGRFVFEGSSEEVLADRHVQEIFLGL